MCVRVLLSCSASCSTAEYFLWLLPQVREVLCFADGMCTKSSSHTQSKALRFLATSLAVRKMQQSFLWRLRFLISVLCLVFVLRERTTGVFFKKFCNFTAPLSRLQWGCDARRPHHTALVVLELIHCHIFVQRSTSATAAADNSKHTSSFRFMSASTKCFQRIRVFSLSSRYDFHVSIK